MAQLQPSDGPGSSTDGSTRRESPRTTADLRDWVHERLGLDPAREAQLFKAIESVVASQRQLNEESKHEAIRALSEGFAEKMARVQRQLTDKDVTVSNIARYFEEVVAELTEKSHRDPKTKLLNFDWFMERLESFLAVEQRVRWCGIGVVDITSFKWYNDTLGHAAGDKIIERVARILSDQIRRRISWRSSAAARPAICTPGSAATSSASSSRTSPAASRRWRSPTASRSRWRPTTGAVTIAAWRRARSASTSASCACGWARWSNVAAWPGSSPPN